MFEVTPDPSADHPPPIDPTIEVCERHLRLLREVAEVAMEVTRALGASAVAAGKAVEEVLGDKVWQPETGRARALAGAKDAAEAFHKAARALRLTLALEKATAETLRDLRAGVVPQANATPAPAATPRDALRDKVRDLLTDAIADAADVTPTREMSDDLNERLAEFDRFGPLLLRPLREVVEQICADIRLAPDWIGLFGEEPGCGRRPDAPLRSRSPILEVVSGAAETRGHPADPAPVPKLHVPQRE